MFSLPRMQLLSLAAAAGVLVISGTPTMADELATNLGPVGPHEPILTAVGSKRVIAFYEPDNGRCAVQAIVYDTTDAYTGMTTAARVRVSLNPREMVYIDGTDNDSFKSLNLQCGDDAATLALVDSHENIAFGTSTSKKIEASASGF
jgi:hypothetical protein